MDYQTMKSDERRPVITSSTLPSAALILAVVGLFFSFIPFIGTICPAIAIALALLSRGKSINTTSKSKFALILGLIGICIAICTTLGSIYYFFDHVNWEYLRQEFDYFYTTGQFL